MFLLQACYTKQEKSYNNTSSIDSTAISFVNNGIAVSVTEIKASGLVITNSGNQRVIGLAKMLIDDHTNAEDGLKKITGDKQLYNKDTIDASHQQMIDDLSKKSGVAFDKTYLQMMIADHEQAVKLFSGAAKNADPDLKSFAVKTLPIIQMHLDSAKAILTSLK